MNGGFQLQLDPFGQLVFIGPDGIRHIGVVPARAFPITAPQEGVSILSRDGHELLWVPDLEKVSGEPRRLIDEELRMREFMPEILRISGVSGYATPCIWQVETDKGDSSFTLKAEEDIRHIASPALLIVDSRGIQFLIRNRHTLDNASRRILDRFL
jgi:hypothetical protein